MRVRAEKEKGWDWRWSVGVARGLVRLVCAARI